MISFENDYAEGAHPAVLQRLIDTNLIQQPGYGNDCWCDSAKEKIRLACDAPEADIHFIVGGTQTNAVVIGTMLAPYEGIIAAETGHINVHEAGAIEYTGHKVLPIPQHEGKILADELETYIARFYADGSHEHMVFPGMVYISHPTEYGTLYTREELTAISQVCRSYDIPLFLDGARLGYGLMSPGTDVDLPFLAEVCDVFYIGGTKVGALFGEAVVISNATIAEDFRYLMKQHGGMLAKGWLLGLQYEALFEDDLYIKISKQADLMADEIREMFASLGYELLVDGVTNQIFPVLPDTLLEKLQHDFTFTEQQRVDASNRAVRFCTSWATEEKAVRALCDAVINLSK